MILNVISFSSGLEIFRRQTYTEGSVKTTLRRVRMNGSLFWKRVLTRTAKPYAIRVWYNKFATVKKYVLLQRSGQIH